MEINNVRFTHIKSEKHDILIPEAVPNIEIHDWSTGVEDLLNPKIERFVIEFQGILERSTVEEDRFLETYLSVGITFLDGKWYGDPPYENMFKTKQEEGKFIESLIHRNDVLEVSKKHEVLYNHLKEKPIIEGYMGVDEMYDEKQEQMIDIVTYIDYEEEGK
ncbi:hypothetical protein ACTFQL_27655 [Bacillus cereus group sp. MYBK44-1]|uniref:hypothetical protein n=1 Tax=unclassified Bacillus cereus group TaxID=2750818 RepID=UPI003F2762A4